MNSKKNILRLLIALSLAAGQTLAADDTADQIRALREQIEALDQKVRELEHQQKVEQEMAEAKAKEAPKISLGENGFSFSSADGDFAVRLKGLMQLDFRSFFSSVPQGNDGFLLRRARPILEGTVYRDFDFAFVPEFGGNSSPQILDAFINYHYDAAFQVRIGKFKSPVGLEALQPDSMMPFIERALPNNLVPSRDLGVLLHGDLFADRVSYAAGVMNGVADGANSGNSGFDNHPELVSRVFVQPFGKNQPELLRGFGVGVAGTYGSEDGSGGVPTYRTDGQQKFFSYGSGVQADGTHWRFSPQGFYYAGPFGVLAEYVISSQEMRETGSPSSRARVQNTAWQIAGSWALTGEKISYKGVTPKHRFDPREGHWGALVLSLRYANLDIDSDAFSTLADPATSARSADAWGVALSWWLNRDVRLSTAFSRTTFDGGASGQVTSEPEEVLFTRVQLAF